MQQSLVSVIIPAYRQAEYVGAAIQSVLDQSYPHFEVIVVNDASPDQTTAVVQRFTDPRVKLIVHDENMGLPTARNTGMRAAAGEIIALLDADDLFHPEKLRLHVEFLAQHADVGVTYNARFELNHSSNTIRELWRPPCQVGLADLVQHFPYAPSDMVIRREWAFQVGLFDPSKGSAEDTDFPCRLALAGCKMVSLDRALNYRRHHSGRGRKNLLGRLNDVRGALNAIFADPRCPDEVLALRDTAIKHHLMVVTSLAFIQNETALAHLFLKELIEDFPTVLVGTPCELLNFLLMESIVDDQVDHAALLRQIFDQLPADLCRLTDAYDWGVAFGYLLKGTRAIFWDRVPEGQVYFTRAAQLHADISEWFVQTLTQHLLNYENEFGLKPTQVVLQRLRPYFQQVGGRATAHHIEASYLVNQAFRHYRLGEYTAIPKTIIRALITDPTYATNRGVLSMLLRSTAALRPAWGS